MTNDMRMQHFAKQHRVMCDSDTEAIRVRADNRPGGRIDGDRDVIQQRCPHCHAMIEIAINDGELMPVELAEDGTVVFQFIAPA